MNYKSKLLFLIIMLFAVLASAKEIKKPNIVFIFADDQSFNMVGALGNTEIITPNLDRLADEGVSFTHSYNMGGWNGALCLASRAMLNTGRTLWRANEMIQKPQELIASHSSWSQLMKQAGYETYMTGKWHVSASADSLFDHVLHVRAGMPKQVPQGYNRPLNENDTLWSPWNEKFGGYWEGGKHWSEVVADDAMTFIDMASQKETPFFMYLAFNAPHDPRQSPKEYIDMYPLERVAVPGNFLPEYPFMEEMGAGKNLRDEQLAPFPRTEYAVKVNRQEYNAITSHMDAQIGKIIEVLRRSGKLDNTYIFFTADHGLSVGNHGLIGKQNMYDHSIRVPLFVMGPNIPKNKKIDADVYLQDIMASALDLAGIEKPHSVEFKSLIPLIKGEVSSNYDAIYGCYEFRQRMIRKDGYKLIVYPRVPVVRLFNLKNDPFEKKDLAAIEGYQKKKKELFNDLVALQQQMGDTLNLKDVFPELVIY